MKVSTLKWIGWCMAVACWSATVTLLMITIVKHTSHHRYIFTTSKSDIKTIIGISSGAAPYEALKNLLDINNQATLNDICQSRQITSYEIINEEKLIK